MDHKEAVRLQAAEKYALGELPKEQVEEYEEHYFDCAECAEDIKATVAFVENARQVVRENANETARAERLAPASTGLFGWLRPAFAIPALAALALFIGYQNGVTIPQLKQASAVSSSAPLTQIVAASIHLMGSVRGGSDEGVTLPTLKVRAGESFLLNFDFTPDSSSSSYICQLTDQTGRVVSQRSLDGNKANQSVSLAVLGGVRQPGKYSLIFYDAVGNAGQSANQKEVQRLTFAVEFPQ